MAIAQQAGEQPALHAVAATATTAAIVVTDRARTHPTPRRGAAGVAGAASVGRAAAQGRAGHEMVRL